MVDGPVQLVEGRAEPGVGWGGSRDDLGQTGAEEAGVGAGEEEGATEAVPGEAVAVGVREALDQAVEAEPAEVVGHPARGELAGSKAQQWREVLALVAVAVAVGVAVCVCVLVGVLVAVLVAVAVGVDVTNAKT